MNQLNNNQIMSQSLSLSSGRKSSALSPPEDTHNSVKCGLRLRARGAAASFCANTFLAEKFLPRNVILSLVLSVEWLTVNAKICGHYQTLNLTAQFQSLLYAVFSRPKSTLVTPDAADFL